MGVSSAGQALLKKGPERFGIDFEVPARAQGRLFRRDLHKALANSQFRNCARVRCCRDAARRSQAHPAGRTREQRMARRTV